MVSFPVPHEAMTLSELAVKQIFETVTGFKPSDIQPLTDGMSSRAWRVAHDGLNYVVRMALPNSGRPISYQSEAEIFKRLQHIEVPTLIATYKDIKVDNVLVPWSITLMVKGKPIQSAGLSVQVAHDLGRVLTVCHSLPVSGYGRLLERGGGIYGKQKTPQQGITDRWCFSLLWPFDGSSLDSNAGYPLFSGAAEGILPLKTDIQLISMDKKVVLVHSDLHGEHIFVKDHSLTGIIDFGAAFIGVAEWEFGRLGFQLGWPATLLVLDTYSGTATSRDFIYRAQLLSLVICLYKINRYITEAAPVVKLNKAVSFLHTTLGLFHRS